MYVDQLFRNLGGPLKRSAAAQKITEVVPGETFAYQSLTPADLDRQRWKLMARGFHGSKDTEPGKGFSEKDKAKLTPQTLASMSKEQLTSVNRGTLTDLHLAFGRELFNETNLTGDRNYGSKNGQRAAYTEALGEIVKIHGNSPVGEEAASMLADYFATTAKVENQEFARTGTSVQAKKDKYGFHGGNQLFRHLVNNPGSMAGSEQILQDLHDTKLNKVSRNYKSSQEARQILDEVR